MKTKENWEPIDCSKLGHDWNPMWLDDDNGIVFYMCFDCNKNCYKKLSFFHDKEFNLENDYGKSTN